MSYDMPYYMHAIKLRTVNKIPGGQWPHYPLPLTTDLQYIIHYTKRTLTSRCLHNICNMVHRPN